MTAGAPLPALDADTERAFAGVAGPGAVILATIWATVDLDRTLAERGIAPSPSRHDGLLGGRVVVAGASPPSPSPSAPPLAIAEPTTEGRLAATLARHGEGPIGRYVAVADGLDAARLRAAAAGIAVSRMDEGPFGPSILVLLGPATGPHLILCEASAVPSIP